MISRKVGFRLCCAVLFLCASLQGFADGKGEFLLTENGANNSANSEYRDIPVLKTGGSYYAMPAFDAAFASKFHEKGTITAQTPFSEGILCNGDTSTDYMRTPIPYVYWSNQPFASLFFDLKKNYFITDVRVKILQVPKIHGISKIGVYTWDEMYDANSRPLKEISPMDGWNGFVIDKPSDKIKLDFTAMAGCAYMTVSEVEIWGSQTELRPAPRPFLRVDSPAKRDYLAFDFGTEDTPLWRDFTPVNGSTVYTKESGYGWVPFFGGKRVLPSSPGALSSAVPGLFCKDRGKEPIVCDDFFRGFCGAENAYHTQIDQEFAVDLRNGKYLVYFGSGDLVYGHPGKTQMTVDSEGKRVINSVTFGNDLCARVQFETDVKDGQLNLHFGNKDADDYSRGWNVSGVLVFSYNNDKEKATAKKAIEDFEKAITAARASAFSARFKEVEYNEVTKLFPLAKSDTDRGYILFVRDWMKTIYSNTVPTKEESDVDKLSIFCSPGEYEPATFGIYPLQDDLVAGIEISDLVSRSKDKIDKKDVGIRVTGYMPERLLSKAVASGSFAYCQGSSSWGTAYMTKFPRILRPYKGKISLDDTRQVWLTVHVPETAKPGKYVGTVTVRPVNKPPQALALEVTVYPIHLQKSDRIEGMYWDDGVPRYGQDRRKELADMAEHGIHAVVLWQALPELTARDGKLVLGFEKLDALVREIKSAGMAGRMPFYTQYLANRINFLIATGAVSMSFDDAYSYAIGEILKHSRENGWPEVLFYPVDEIGNVPERMATLKRLSSLIKAQGGKVYCTVNNYASGVECADSIDYWCANIQMPRVQEQDVLNRGKVLFRYGGSYNYDPRASRTVSGFGFWRIPAPAMYYWNYEYINGDPYSSLDCIERDYLASYPSPEGPINSIDFEAIREGIDDLNYIYTMQQLMDKAKKVGKDDLAKSGQAILDEITGCDPSYSQYDLAGISNEKYHEWRQRMAQEIIKLQSALR